MAHSVVLEAHAPISALTATPQRQNALCAYSASETRCRRVLLLTAHHHGRNISRVGGGSVRAVTPDDAGGGHPRPSLQ